MKREASRYSFWAAFTLLFLLVFLVDFDTPLNRGIDSASITGNPIAPQPKLFSRALVPNLDSGTVSIFDTVRNQVIATIPVAVRPRFVAMSGDGRFAYVTSDTMSTTNGTISKVDMNRLVLVKFITVLYPPNTSSNTRLHEIEISPNGRWVVTASATRGAIHIIDTTLDTVVSTLELCPLCGTGGTPIHSGSAFAFSLDSQFLYAADSQTASLYVIDLRTQSIVQTLPLLLPAGDSYDDLKLSQDGNYLWVIRSRCESGICAQREFHLPTGTFQDIVISNFTLASDFEPVLDDTKIAFGKINYAPYTRFIDVYDRITGTLASIPSSISNRDLTYDPQSKKLFGICITVGYPYDCFPGSLIGTIDVFDMVSNQLLRTVHTTTRYGFPSLSQDGRFFYFVISNNAIGVLDTVSYSVIQTIAVGNNPRGVYMQGDSRVKEFVV